MDFSSLLNDKQYEACIHTEGPLLIIAGAGSGKTRVLTHRIAYLMQEKGVKPWNIMAITFTNKAANEMRERVDRIAGFGAEAVWVSTFHSSCARILRRFIDRLGYTNSFSIYDTDDSKTLLKNIISNMELDPKKYPPKMLQYIISGSKNRLVTAEMLEADAVTQEDEVIASVYREYDKALYKNNALDFDDLLIKTVELFEKHPDVLDSYQERLRYIMVDEYQDTNGIQFKLIKLLSAKYRNLCVVGDDDQSIYKFRGADIRNILNFEKIFPDAKVVKLEQNYRSTANILNGANSVIANNTERKSKTLWTSREDGAKISKHHYQDAYEEARAVISDIASRSVSEPYNAFAVLYRTNAQSRIFEEMLVRENIPYRIVGGINFYSRKEIKDVLAYLKTIDNGRDEISVRRIINIPRRGIGDKTIEKISDFAGRRDHTFFEACADADLIPGLGRTASKVKGFTDFIRVLRSCEREYTVPGLIEKLLNDTGYRRELEDEGTDEARDRIENINELISKAEAYQQASESPSLSGFLQEVALVADIDSLDESNDRVCLMTVHSAKGLEFDNVYLVGMEDGLFPSISKICDVDDSELQEERRLFYVGMTRARNTLKLTSAQIRFVQGEPEYHKVSMFAEEIDPAYVTDETAWEMNRSYGTSTAFSRPERTPGNDSFRSRKSFEEKTPKPPYGKVFDPNKFKVSKADSLEYSVGDRVRHKKFGAGTVLEIKDGAKDHEVTVDFDNAGRKRMFAAFARLEKV